ncbi:hypothetical protein [Bacillus sp. SD088]|uniref:hypothetical protein n=1 Tax=Bacillus sp. SD088 TaxID=2782012 RepID=UPI001A957F1F|nr:hypothetical protein [Bacillus sp. SD088]MBO0991844.1 hypothetical protein [Bacillus sp. SD088]
MVVLEPQEFYQFISLLKGIAPYQLKVGQAKQQLKPYYDKLDQAWFTETTPSSRSLRNT